LSLAVGIESLSGHVIFSSVAGEARDFDERVVGLVWSIVSQYTIYGRYEDKCVASSTTARYEVVERSPEVELESDLEGYQASE
jgi:hypothetical protein